MSTLPRVVALILATLFAPTAVNNLSLAQEPSGESFLKLSFEQFDQDMNGGWRVNAKSRKYADAATMIESYLSQRDDLTPENKRMLHFHAGQMWAMGDQKTKAIEHLKKSTQSKENDFLRWNAYVAGTIAFLEKDTDKLEAAREEVAKAEIPLSFNKNLVVLDKLRESPESSYRKIFEGLMDKNKKSAIKERHRKSDEQP